MTLAILSRVSDRPPTPAAIKARTESAALAVRPAPLVKAPDSSLRPSPSKSRTPSGPRRSSLSTALKTPSFWPSVVTPAVASRPLSSLRLLILMTYPSAGRPAAISPSAAMAMISASASGRAEPTVSASHCVNSRKRPGPGFSLRQTVPKAYRRKGLGKVSQFCAANRAKGAVRS